MKFSFVNIITEHVLKQFNTVDRISDFLEFELAAKNYGEGLTEAIFGMGCNGPLSEAWVNIPTGQVNHLKYTKSKKRLELTVSLGYEEMKDASEDQIIEIVKRAILLTYEPVNALNVKDFQIQDFYHDIEKLIDTREWLSNPDKYKKPPFVFNMADFMPQRKKGEQKMKAGQFWDIINSSQSIQEDVKHQIEIIADQLSSKSEKEIIGFELTLRELLDKSNHHNVLALLSIMNEDVSDDTYLYFRCRLILYGQKIFELVLKDPNALTHKLAYHEDAELLLSVSDDAFNKKFGIDNDKELPSEIGAAYYDYNINDTAPKGKPWQPEDLRLQYKVLYKLYHTFSDN